MHSGLELINVIYSSGEIIQSIDWRLKMYICYVLSHPEKNLYNVAVACYSPITLYLNQREGKIELCISVEHEYCITTSLFP